VAGQIDHFLKPLQRIFIFGFGKMFDVGMYEVGGECWQSSEQTVVANDCESFVVLVIGLDELQVTNCGFKIHPFGKGRGDNYYSGQCTMLREIRIHVVDHRFKVGGFQRA
jgi:hypothetical protein